ncbi:dihydrofolate reductase family protein [Prolixibacteraceae bacterium Z1-6]|uniref:Dihydrofolate reductase family protein n=1 Tax=Draconibacterium aestuarii TaxID=2998507 RepID=A0A9X3FHW2_9BACT|nr:dihydrofolate reductase family protein [Prolixibacteraceae bacterium Z1-6]
MNSKNYVFIAKSLDGYIADKNGGIDWLHSIPNPDGLDMGYNAFTDQIDAIVMGRKTFDVVCSFTIPWPYTKPVFVVSNSLKIVPEVYRGKVELVTGVLPEIVAHIHGKGLNQLYIDGGTLIQSFLKEDLIDEMIITTIPILLGGGFPLFGELAEPLEFEHVKSEVFLNAITQDTYRRRR